MEKDVKEDMKNMPLEDGGNRYSVERNCKIGQNPNRAVATKAMEVVSFLVLKYLFIC